MGARAAVGRKHNIVISQLCETLIDIIIGEAQWLAAGVRASMRVEHCIIGDWQSGQQGCALSYSNQNPGSRLSYIPQVYKKILTDHMVMGEREGTQSQQPVI